jgi:hypothetical protein
MESSSSSDKQYEDPQPYITPDDVFTFQSFMQDIQTAKDKELEEIYRTDTDRAVANDFVNNLVTDVTSEVERTRQTYTRSRNSVDILGRPQFSEESLAEKHKHSHFEKERLAAIQATSNTQSEAEGSNEFSDMSRKELEELVRSLSLEVKILNQNIADRDSELEQSKYVIQQLQNELSSISPIMNKETVNSSESNQVRQSASKMKKSLSKSSFLPSTVKSEEPDFWRITEEKAENELTKFEEIAAAKDLWIVNAEKLPLNTYLETKHSSFNKSPGVKANPLTKQPLANLTRNERLTSKPRQPPGVKSRMMEPSKTNARSVPKIINKSAFVKS